MSSWIYLLYNIVFHFAIHLDGPAWSDADIPAND